MIYIHQYYCFTRKALKLKKHFIISYCIIQLLNYSNLFAVLKEK